MSAISDKILKVAVGYYNANAFWLDGQAEHTVWSYSHYQEVAHEPWSGFILELRNTVYLLEDAVYYLIYHSATQPDYYNLYYILRFFDEQELSWRSICEALVANDFEGKYWTIAIIDRMRQLIWDKPFSIKWAANPTEGKE